MLGRDLGGEGVEIGPLAFGQTLAILEQHPAQALEAGIGFLFEAAGFIDGGRGMSDDVELVEGDTGIGQMLAHALDEGRRHVDADAGDLLGLGLVFA